MICRAEYRRNGRGRSVRNLLSRAAPPPCRRPCWLRESCRCRSAATGEIALEGFTECVVDGDARLFDAGRRERRWADDVAGGIDVRNLGRLKLRADLHQSALAGRQAGRREVQARCCSCGRRRRTRRRRELAPEPRQHDLPGPPGIASTTSDSSGSARHSQSSRR